MEIHFQISYRSKKNQSVGWMWPGATSSQSSRWGPPPFLTDGDAAYEIDFTQLVGIKKRMRTHIL